MRTGAPRDRHRVLIAKASRLHDRLRYAEALPFAEEAYRIAPACPAVLYNLANTLHMLGRGARARTLLRRLVSSSTDSLRRACPANGSPRSFQVDAHYLLFEVELYRTRDWRESLAHARRHLKLRTRGLRSVWTRRGIERRIVDLRARWLAANRDATAP